jgi:hypothetical protein
MFISLWLKNPSSEALQLGHRILENILQRLELIRVLTPNYLAQGYEMITDGTK